MTSCAVPSVLKLIVLTLAQGTVQTEILDELYVLLANSLTQPEC